MALAIDGVALHPVRMPLSRTVRWASSSEAHADYMILELRAGGLRGVAEGCVKLNFAATTLKVLAAAFEDIFTPRLVGIDVLDAEAVARALTGIREHRLAKAMIDAAVWDLRAQSQGRPLWRFLGGASPSVKMSFTVTRDTPAEMARGALRAVGGHRIATLKIKTGQGMARDAEALAAIRTVIGAGNVQMYADSNRAYSPEEVGAFTAMLLDHGVIAAEDPCGLAPDRAFAAIKGRSRVPLLVDGPCRSAASMHLFLEAGAEALSLKVGKSGFTESLAMAAMARRAGARVHIGMLAESELGALAAASLSSALAAAGEPWLPCEASYFLQLPESLLKTPLVVANGALELPEKPGFADLLDWEKVARLAP